MGRARENGEDRKGTVPGGTPLPPGISLAHWLKSEPEFTRQVRTGFGCPRPLNRLTCVSLLKIILEIKPESGETVNVLTWRHVHTYQSVTSGC